MAVRKPGDPWGVVDAARALEAGTLSSEGLVRSCLERIEALDATVRAFVAVDAAAALEQARQAGAARRSVLAGIPYAAKDVLDTSTLPTAYGSPIYDGHRPVADAACIALAREQGAVLLGKVATSEFATQSPGPTRNPLDPGRTPGGSSSGSAAAVAAGMVPVAFGTQTTGSIVRPAAYCGVVGYKPTHGLLPATGLKALSPSQDTVGVLARDVPDAACFAFGLLGLEATSHEATSVRVALCESSQWQHLSAESVAAIEAAAAALPRAGLPVHRIALPPTLEALLDVQPRLVAYEARQSLAHERLHHWDRLSPRLQARLDGGAGLTAADALAMREAADQGRQAVQALFADADVLLYPAADGVAEAGLEESGSPRYGALWTLLHMPCVCVPLARGGSGLPLGIQVIGRRSDDLRLLGAAQAIARALA